MISKLTVEEAERLIKETDLQDTQNCSAEVDDILKKYNCGILPHFEIIGDQILYDLIFVKNRTQPQPNGKPALQE